MDNQTLEQGRNAQGSDSDKFISTGDELRESSRKG
jgi:hypothetical protein